MMDISPASNKHEEARCRGRAADSNSRKWCDMLEELACACPLHDTHDMDPDAQSYEGEVEACKDMVRRPGEKECLMALKGLLATCKEYNPAAQGCNDGWKDNADCAERHCLAPFRETLKKAAVAVADAMTCEVCGEHPDDDWAEWGCYECGIECCTKCAAFHVCGEKKGDQRDIELGREAGRARGERFEENLY